MQFMFGYRDIEEEHKNYDVRADSSLLGRNTLSLGE
jgi:hypothetical protein